MAFPITWFSLLSPGPGQKQQWFDIHGDGNVSNFKLIMGLVLGIGLSVILLIMVGVCVVFWRLRRAPEDNFVVVCESALRDEDEDKKKLHCEFYVGCTFLHLWSCLNMKLPIVA